MNEKRLGRINEEIKRVVSEIIINGLKDPRVDSLTSVTHVKTTNDLRYVNIYVGILGDAAKKKEVLDGLNSAKGFIRREIGQRVDLRYVPEPNFHIDEAMENAIYMNELINSVSKGTEDE